MTIPNKDIFIVLSHFISAIALVILTTFIIIFSVFISNLVTKNLIQKDHKSIVIDELAGMWVALVPVIWFASDQLERIIYACLALVFFRVFDILKPFPISYFDKKYKNGFGIVLDDIIAGIFSGILSVLIVVFLI